MVMGQGQALGCSPMQDRKASTEAAHRCAHHAVYPVGAGPASDRRQGKEVGGTRPSASAVQQHAPPTEKQAKRPGVRLHGTPPQIRGSNIRPPLASRMAQRRGGGVHANPRA